MVLADDSGLKVDACGLPGALVGFASQESEQLIRKTTPNSCNELAMALIRDRFSNFHTPWSWLVQVREKACFVEADWPGYINFET